MISQLAPLVIALYASVYDAETGQYLYQAPAPIHVYVDQRRTLEDSLTREVEEEGVYIKLEMKK